MSEEKLSNAVGRALSILELVAESSNGLSNSDLSRRLQIPKSSASYILRVLEQRGFVQRVKSEGDRRVTRIQPTDVGAAEYEALTEEWKAPVHGALAELDADDRAALAHAPDADGERDRERDREPLGHQRDHLADPDEEDLPRLEPAREPRRHDEDGHDPASVHVVTLPRPTTHVPRVTPHDPRHFERVLRQRVAAPPSLT